VAIVWDYGCDEDVEDVEDVEYEGDNWIAVSVSDEPCQDNQEIDEMKSNMDFYQLKMHRRKKGGKISFK